MKATLLNYGLYQAGWFCCVLGAAYGRPAIGAGLALLLIGVHLLLTDRLRRELRVLLAAGATGLVVDSLQTATGLLRFDTGLLGGALAPPWLIVLWLQFATTLHYCMRWLLGRPALAAVLGFVGGPLAFWAGQRLGAVRFTEPAMISLLAVGLAWAVALPLLLQVARRGDPRPGIYHGFS